MSLLEGIGYFTIGCAGGLYAACWMQCAKTWRETPRCGFPWRLAAFGPILLVLSLVAWLYDRLEKWVIE